MAALNANPFRACFALDIDSMYRKCLITSLQCIFCNKLAEIITRLVCYRYYFVYCAVIAVFCIWRHLELLNLHFLLCFWSRWIFRCWWNRLSSSKACLEPRRSAAIVMRRRAPPCLRRIYILLRFYYKFCLLIERKAAENKKTTLQYRWCN